MRESFGEAQGDATQTQHPNWTLFKIYVTRVAKSALMKREVIQRWHRWNRNLALGFLSMVVEGSGVAR